MTRLSLSGIFSIIRNTSCVSGSVGCATALLHSQYPARENPRVVLAYRTMLLSLSMYHLAKSFVVVKAGWLAVHS
jgi:hypothetical protein